MTTHPAGSGTPGRITGLRTVGVPVADQDAAVTFYVHQLGLDKRVDAPIEQLQGRWIEVAPPGSETTIALVPAGEGTPAGVETGIRLTTADATSTHSYLREQGVDVGDLLRWDEVPTMFSLRDPDGNNLTIVEQTIETH